MNERISYEHYRPLGRTGVQVSPLTLGAMMFGAWGNTDHDDSIAIIHRALDAGINVIDTADVYARGESEEIVGKALQARAGSRDDVFLATKFHAGMHDEDPNQQGNSRRWIVREVESSLRRLQVDHIDLYQVHRPDPRVDVDETLGALTDLVRQGKIRYLGTSTFLPSQVVEAQWVAEKRQRERPVTEQPPYSILAREVERDILPTAEKYGLGVLPWSPLAGGWLSGRYRRGGERPATSSRMSRQPARHDPDSPENRVKLEAVYALQELAEEAGLSLIHLAIGFVIAHPAISSAIIGPRTMEQLESQLGAAEVALPADVLDRIDEIVPPGTTLNEADRGYAPPALVEAALRRR
ncbi:aldo/keto reductase [Nocardioides hwasunensis]|uniref:Aldo/keto reductase n=1 Tax=Nocardioides hwasunensis TaxID=397258 RepID=A0ABR8MHB7_9ACTN|nr:aldo/keto reductase [Nocardioides hwasunensis]MBD3915462.1 aldo/keto reductase [Nocardioides hwasunensis]